MPNYLIKPQATHTTDPEDLTGAVLALDIADPGTVNGLPNGVAHVAMEVLLSPVSPAFTPSTTPAQMGAPSLQVADQTITATLASDPTNGGSAITARDLRYSTDEASWTTQNTVSSPVTLSGLTSATTYFVQTRARNANGAGPWSASASASTGSSTTLVFIENAGNEAELTAAGTGSITVTAPAGYAGTTAITINDMDGGPVALSPPAIISDGSPAQGETLTATSGLWLYDSAGTAPTLSYQWTRNGADIAGATGTSYGLTATDAGTTIALRETATQAAFGNRNATSISVNVAGSGGGGGFSDDFTGFATGAIISAASTNYALQTGAGHMVQANDAVQPNVAPGVTDTTRTAYDAEILGQAQFAEIVVSDAGAGYAQFGVEVRFVNSGTYFRVVGQHNSTVVADACVGFTQTHFAAFGNKISTGDTLRVEITASDIASVWINGVKDTDFGDIDLSGSNGPSGGTATLYTTVTPGTTSLPQISAYSCGNL